MKENSSCHVREEEEIVGNFFLQENSEAPCT
jgi:hypothetical protein